jgi:hypothetical protein
LSKTRSHDFDVCSNQWRMRATASSRSRSSTSSPSDGAMLRYAVVRARRSSATNQRTTSVESRARWQYSAANVVLPTPPIPTAAWVMTVVAERPSCESTSSRPTNTGFRAGTPMNWGKTGAEGRPPS